MIAELFTRERVLRIRAFLIDLAVLLALFACSAALFGAPDFLGAQRELGALSGLQGSPDELQAQANIAIASFNSAYSLALMIWLGYELVSLLLSNGRTIGKAVAGLRVEAVKNPHNRLTSSLKMAARCILKVLLLYLFKGFPLVLALMYIFSDPTNRAGYDRMSGTRVAPCLRKKRGE